MILDDGGDATMFALWGARIEAGESFPAPENEEEERRLFYVGVTRARDRLYLTYPERRTMRGRVTPLTRSRFLEGLPEDALEVYQSPVKQTLELDEVAAMAEALLAKLAGNA